jgi:Protein of unknown function (DUF1761)
MNLSGAAANVNWLAILIAPLLGFVLGGLWYGPLFGKAWMRASGVTEDQARAGNNPKKFALVYVLNLIASFSLAMFIGPNADWRFGLTAGALTGLTFISMALGVTYLFESRPFRLLLINGAYQTLMFAGMGLILGAWR